MRKSTYRLVEAAQKTAVNLTMDEGAPTHLYHQFSHFDLVKAFEEAQDDFEQKSDAWQESEKGIEEAARLEQLESAIEAIENAAESLESAEEQLRELIENAPEGSFGK